MKRRTWGEERRILLFWLIIVFLVQTTKIKLWVSQDVQCVQAIPSCQEGAGGVWVSEVGWLREVGKQSMLSLHPAQLPEFAQGLLGSRALWALAATPVA